MGDSVLKDVVSTVAVRLERCTRSLASYLSAKRAKFPNFYFVSDTALLELLAGTCFFLTPAEGPFASLPYVLVFLICICALLGTAVVCGHAAAMQYDT